MLIRPHPKTQQSGVALIIVMVVIFVLAALAGGFAYSMKVEMTLARNARDDVEMDWMARSGVELARYILIEQLRCTAERYDSLNQLWAGGPGLCLATNEFFAEISMDDYEIGSGTISIRITDQERKFGINMADDRMMRRALDLVGVDAGEIPIIVDSFMDWLDKDDDPHLSGAESSYYLGLDPPYYAKNGLIDELSELLLIRGITPEIYEGSDIFRESVFERGYMSGGVDMDIGPVGLVELFSIFHAGPMNINTASQAALRLLFDDHDAAGIIAWRSGLDGVDGTEDDVPYENVGQLVNAGISPEVAQEIQRQNICGVRSFHFEVEVDVTIGSYTRRYIAVLRRQDIRDIHIVRLYAE